MALQAGVDPEEFLEHMFASCTLDQANDFIPERRGFRIHGHSTTIRLERVFWSVLEDMSARMNLAMPDMITRVYDRCILANDKNISSCLRVVCMKYVNIYAV